MRRYKNVQKAYVCCPIAYHGFSVTTIAMPTLADDGENVYEEIFVYDSTVQLMSNSKVPEALLTIPEGETGELLRAVGKKVYVAQDYDEDGNVIGSHLMTNAEVRSSELIGQDSEYFRGLTIFCSCFLLNCIQMKGIQYMAMHNGMRVPMTYSQMATIKWQYHGAAIKRLKPEPSDAAAGIMMAQILLAHVINPISLPVIVGSFRNTMDSGGLRVCKPMYHWSV